MVRNQDAIFKELGLEIRKSDREKGWLQVGVEAGVLLECRMPEVGEFLKTLSERGETELPEFTDGGPRWPLSPSTRCPGRKQASGRVPRVS